MSVLVTGGAGYIGSHMVLELLSRGERPVVVDGLSTGFRWSVAPEAHFIEGDIGDGPFMERVLAEHRIRAIVHFAAKVVVPDSVADPLGYYLANTVKTRNLVEAAVRTGVENFVFSSTAAVYGNPPVNPVTEDVAPNPMSPYGINYAVLRYFNVAGADPEGRTGQSTPNATHLIKVAVQAALGHRANLDVFGTDYETRDGTCVRDYIHVSDLVAAHTCALSHLRNGGESVTLNCGYGRGYSVLEVVDAVKRISGVDFRVDLVDRRPGDPAKIVAGADKIRRMLGWHPEHEDLDRIVMQALDWERRLRERAAA
jgi:UDP-glucose 4-epimerase